MKARRFDSLEALTAEIAALLGRHLRANSPKPHAVMLSGGRTPLPAYQALAAARCPVGTNTHILFSDERVVPPDSAESNYGCVRPMLSALHVPDDRVIRVKTEHGLEEAASLYDADLARFLRDGSVSLGLLGLGADGHTASLFSLDDVLRGRGRMAIPVPKDRKPDRVSVTAGFLERIDLIVFLAAGPDKAEIVERLLREPVALPAGRAVANARNVELWMA